MLGTSSTGPRDRARGWQWPTWYSYVAAVTVVELKAYYCLLLLMVNLNQILSYMFGINHAILRGFFFYFHFMYLCVPVITCIVPVQLKTYLQTCRLMSNTHAMTIHSKIKTKHHADKCFIHITSKLRYSVVIHLTTPVRIIKVNWIWKHLLLSSVQCLVIL